MKKLLEYPQEDNPSSTIVINHLYKRPMNVIEFLWEMLYG